MTVMLLVQVRRDDQADARAVAAATMAELLPNSFVSREANGFFLRNLRFWPAIASIVVYSVISGR